MSVFRLDGLRGGAGGGGAPEGFAVSDRYTDAADLAANGPAATGSGQYALVDDYPTDQPRVYRDGGTWSPLSDAVIYATRAALEAAWPAANNDGEVRFVATGTAGAGRAFRSDGSSWAAVNAMEWRTSSTGSAGERALRDAAGAAIAHGDVGRLGNGLQLYAVTDEDDRVAWIPRYLEKGVILGVTHEAEAISILWKEDPAAAGWTVSDTADYDTTTAGKIHIEGQLTAPGTPLADAYGYWMGLIGAAWTTSAGDTFDSLAEISTDIGGTDERFIISVPKNAADYKWLQSGLDTTITGLTHATERDILFGRLAATTTYHRYAYSDFPSPATGDAVPTLTASRETGTPDTGLSPRFRVVSYNALDCDGLWAVALTAI